jgi:hypothetical protein
MLLRVFTAPSSSRMARLTSMVGTLLPSAWYYQDGTTIMSAKSSKSFRRCEMPQPTKRKRPFGAAS